MQRRAMLLSAVILPFAGRGGFAQTKQAAAAGSGRVSVLYAGSLVNLMEHGIGPAFDAAGGASFQGFGAGSNGLANQIKGKLRRGDVFISAVPSVNGELMGQANGNWVSWYVGFAQSPLVIGYNAASRFAGDLKGKPWYEALQEPGIRIGRTDPRLDPKGRLTVELLDSAASLYRLPDLPKKVLGAAENPAQVFPEPELVGRLQSGQLDAGFFYSTETSDLKIPAITLPPEAARSAHYTATVLRDAPNADGAVQFVSFLLGPQGQQVMTQHGLDLVKPSVAGDAGAVPAAIRSLIHS